MSRSVEEIATAEMLGLIHANRHLLNEANSPFEYARLIGMNRLAQSARTRIEEIIALVK